jgi:hypothetical protein
MNGLGELLKSERLQTKISISEITQKTNIQGKIILALEQNDYSNIPGKFYLKNFIKDYLVAIGVNYKEFLLKHKDLINNIHFDCDAGSHYIYKMKYSKFERRGLFFKFLVFILLFIIGYFALYKNFDKIKEFLTPERAKGIETIPCTGIYMDNIPNILYYGFDNINKQGDDLINEQLNFSYDKYAVNLVIIVNKTNYITVFQNNKKILGREFKSGEILKLKGYSFLLHTQFSSAIDVLLNGKKFNYFKNKTGYQKLLITNKTKEK